MPVSRYQLRNEYSLADPEFYGAADLDDPEALLEGVAMAGLVGVLRQIGDLAEFAAEIFHDLHEEVMSTAARGHGLMIRVQQLEADFPSIEKAFLSQINHSRFTYNAGTEWHATLHSDQNLITQGDLPRFIMDSYEECRGPPRLFLLDKFDMAGAGACLKRYSDPSIFKTEFASSGMKIVEVEREKKARKIKKKGRRWWNEEPPEIFTTSHFNAKLHQVASDENVSEKIPTHGVKLKRRHLNSTSSNSITGRSYMEPILEMHLPEAVPELHEIATDDLTNRILYKEKNLVQSPNRQEILESPVIELRENIIDSGFVVTKPVPIAKYKVEEVSSTFNQVQKDLLVDRERKIEVSADSCGPDEFEIEKIPTISQLVDQKDAFVDRGSIAASGADEYRSEDVASELDNYVDAMETDTNLKVKHEPDFFNLIRRMDSNMIDEQQELCAQCVDSYSVKNSSAASYDWNGSLENQESGHSDLDNISNSADLQPPPGNGIASLDMHENFEELSQSEDANLGLPHDDLYFKSVEKLKSSSDGDVAANPYVPQIHDMSSEKLSSNGDVLGPESLETLLPNGTVNDLPEAPSHIPKLCKTCSSSCINGSTSTRSHSCLHASLSAVQLARLDPAEVLSGYPEVDGESSSKPEEVGKHVGDDIPHAADISNFPSETSEGVQPRQFDEIRLDASSIALLHSSDILNWPRGMKYGNDVMEEVFPTEYVEDCSAADMLRVKTFDCIFNELPVTDIRDPPSGTNDDAILEKTPMGYVEEGPGVENSIRRKLGSLNLMEEPDILTKQDEDACSGGISVQTYLINVQTDRYSLGIENGALSNENSEYSSSDVDLQEIDDIRKWESDKMSTSSISHESGHFYDGELPDIHVKDLGKLLAECSGREALSSNNLESMSNASETGVKDETVREGNHLSDFNVMENSSFNVDFLSMSMISNYPAEASSVKVCTLPDDVGAGCILVENNFDDSVPEPTSSPKVPDNYTELQHECILSKTASDLYGQPSNESSSQDDIIGSENELNEQVVGSTSLDLVPSSPDSPYASGFLHCVHHLVPGEDVQIHRHLSNDNLEAFITSMESDQVSELKSPHHSYPDEKGSVFPTSFSLEPAITSETSEQERAIASEQAPEVQTGTDLSTVSEHEEGCSPEYSNVQYETVQSLEQMGSQHESKERISSPCNHESDSSKLPKCSPDSSISAALTPIFPAINLPINEMVNQGSFEQQPNQSINGFPLTVTDALQANLEEMPPLPPLPPLEWRIGKIQYGSSFLGQETMHLQSSFQQLHTTENQNPQQGFSTAGVSSESLNTFAPLQTTECGVSQHILQTLFGKMPQPPKSFTPSPAVEEEKPQHGFLTLGGEMVPPRSSSAPLPMLEEDDKDNKPQDSSLPTTVDGESQHILQTLVGEMPQPPNSFTPPPTVEDKNPQYGFLILGEKMVPPRSSSTPLPTIEVEKNNKPQDDSLTIEGEMLQPLKSYATPPIAEDEKIQHGLFTSDGQSTQPPNPFSSLPTEEYEKLNDLSKPTRPRDPLIEAVASHNRTMLRKVSERGRPKISPKADEKDSLLEQIRSKSFNLKPAVMKKPALQGPKTNLNVVAILEKANSIRQAFVGSDEDDEDGWSDT